MTYQFVSIASGEKFTDPLPETVSAVHSVEVGNGITAIVEDTRSEGEPGYEKALVAYMFSQGYIAVGADGQRVRFG